MDSQVIPPTRKSNAPRTTCTKPGCSLLCLEGGYRFCGKHANAERRAMEASGWLTPALGEIRFFYNNGLYKKFT
jgi:hypothetical protein